MRNRDDNDRGRGDWQRGDWDRGDWDGHRGDRGRDWDRDGRHDGDHARHGHHSGDWDRHGHHHRHGNWDWSYRRNWNDWNRYGYRDWGYSRYGYSRYGYWPSRTSFFFGIGSPFGWYAWPRYDYGYGYGYYPWRQSYGYGYPWGVVASRVLIGVPYLGWLSPIYYGSGHAYYGGYSPDYTTSTVYYSYQPTTVANEVVVTEPPAVAVEQQAVVAEAQVAEKPAVVDFAEQGEIDFKAADYESAIRNWQHALVDDPGNGALILLLGQAFFASGKYDEAAGATQQALQLIPKDKWNVVIANRRDLYGNEQPYRDQLKALEAAAAKENSPALHFLLGYHHGFLGERDKAASELAKTLELAPQDEIARQLQEVITSGEAAVAAPPSTTPDLVLPPLPQTD